ncbi:MAG: SdrD B-like domain-containing protein, partial [Candidatus Methanoperedens sp.]|nr:SdrD B-like domain-containing protein [Candidatus Methanoperedens sp.]
MYQFTGLSNGTYTVTEIMQTDWTNVTPTSIDVLIEGADVMNQNFTNTPSVPPVSGQTFNISGFKINNSNNLGVPGWAIDLKNETMNVSATTAENGMYQFMGLANGTYTVTEIMQTDWTNVTPTSIDVLIEGADVMNKNFTNVMVPAPDLTIDLDLGWNLISIPNFADPSSVDMALKNVKNNGVVGYDPATKTFSTPTDLYPLYGYWINVTEPNQSLGFFADKSITSVPPSRNLYEGWNLIGVVAEESETNKTLDAGLLFQSLQNGGQPLYSFLVSYKNPRHTYVVGVDLSDRTALNQGQGYWLFIKTMTQTDKNSVIWSGKPWLPN